MLQIYDMGPTALLPLQRKACWGFFHPKNPTTSAGFEPANLGTKGQYATARPLCDQKWKCCYKMHALFFKHKFQEDMCLVQGRFIHSIGVCIMWWLLAILRSFFRSSLLCTFSCHPSPPTILPSSLNSSCHLFLGLPLNFVVPKFMYNTLLGILFSSILSTCPNQRNLFDLIVSIIVGLLTLA